MTREQMINEIKYNKEMIENQNMVLNQVTANGDEASMQAINTEIAMRQARIAELEKELAVEETEVVEVVEVEEKEMQKQNAKIELQRKIENATSYKPARVRWEQLQEMSILINKYTELHGYEVSVFFKQGLKNELTLVKNGEVEIAGKPMNNNEIYEIIAPIHEVSMDLKIQEIDEKIAEINRDLEELGNSTIEATIAINENINPEELTEKEIEEGDLVINNVSITRIGFKVEILSEDASAEGMEIGEAEIDFSNISIIGKFKDIKALRTNLNIEVLEYILSEYIATNEPKVYTEDDINEIENELEYYRIGEEQ